ncbi:MAG: hypothetical protein ABFS37_02975 [Acidobacteriota bacterium]
MKSTTGKASLGLQGCLETCRRCEHLVRLCSETTVDSCLFEAIGPHLRHCLDHFRSLLTGLDTGTIDYDARERDPGLETDPGLFLAALYEVTAELAGLGGISTTQAVEVTQTPAPERPPISVGSTLERELIFLSSHTIHHLALVIEVAEGRGVEMPPHLGLAFSTAAFLEHRETAAS